MKDISKKLCSFVLVLVLVFSYVPVVTAAELEEGTDSENVETVITNEEDVENGSIENPESSYLHDQTETLHNEIEVLDLQSETEWDTIKVFETTDVHGYITDVSTYNEDTFQYRLAWFANIVNQARESEEYDDVLLLDTGDIYQGTPHSNLTYGAALRAAFDVMEYDAVGLGNHEFDWDVMTYAADSEGTMAPYEIGTYKGDSDIPVLMSNLYDKGTDERVDFTQDYTVVDKADYKVAIIGWACDYSSDIKASLIEPYTIDEDMEKLNALTKEVKEKENADIVIVLSHSDPVLIADYMDANVVDLVAGGHTHRNVNGVSEKTGIAYMQGYCYAYGYSQTEIKINPETKEVKVDTPEYGEIAPRGDVSHLYESNADNFDEEVFEISKAAWDAVKDDMYEVLCVVDTDITRTFINEETNATVAGNWLAGLMLDITEDLNTTAAFTNRGGIRTSLERAEGETTRDITVADIYTISPFGNRILTYSITGKQLAQHLENALIGLNPEIGIDTDAGYAASNYGDQFAGISITYKVVDGGIKVTSILTDSGEVIDVNDTTKTYNVCLNEYNATLDGSVFKNLIPLVTMDDAPIDNLSTIEALQERRESEGLQMEVDTSVHSIKVEDRIQQIVDIVNGFNTSTITVADKTKLEQLLNEIDVMISSGGLSEEECVLLRDVRDDVAALLVTISESGTPNTEIDGNNSSISAASKDNHSKTSGKKVKAARTGDTDEALPMLFLLFMSGICAVGVIEASQRKRNRR